MSTPALTLRDLRKTYANGFEVNQVITFMSGFFRGEFGQYFTPRNIGFNLANIKQIRVKDTNGLRQDIKKQIEIFYGLSGQTA